MSRLLIKLRPQPQKRENTQWSLQPQSPLLNLPGELRNKIYHLVLINLPDESDPITPKDKLPNRLELRTLRLPALAATCRQLQHESLSYFFRYATFTYTITLDRDMLCTYRLDRSTKRWLRAVGAEKWAVFDVVLGVEVPVLRKSVAPGAEERVRFNVYHIVGSECTDCTSIAEIQESKERWWDALYKKFLMKFSEARQVEELSVGDFASIMAQWVWMPSARVGMFRRRWSRRGARVLGKLV